MLLTCLEWWAFELSIIFAGLIGVKELAAAVALMNVNIVVYMFPLGF
jgi:hypothetical protein